MTHRRIQEIQLVLQAELFEMRARCRVHPRALPAVFHIDLIHILHQPDRLSLADIFIECPAKIICDIVLAVRKGARAAKSAHDRAALALDTAFHLVAVDRAVPPVKRMPCLKDRDLQIALPLDHLIRREDPPWSCPYYDHIVTHTSYLAFHESIAFHYIEYTGFLQLSLSKTIYPPPAPSCAARLLTENRSSPARHSHMAQAHTPAQTRKSPSPAQCQRASSDRSETPRHPEGQAPC